MRNKKAIQILLLISLISLIFLQVVYKDELSEIINESLELESEHYEPFENTNSDFRLRIFLANTADTNVKVGDGIPVVFTITNISGHDYQYNKRYYDRSGRMDEFKLEAKDSKGKIVADPREDIVYGIRGGLMGGTDTIRPGQSFTFTVDLNRWALINKAGEYTITGTYSYSVPKKPNPYPQISSRIMETKEVKSRPITVKIKSRWRWSMGRYIKKLQQQLNSATSEDEREGILIKLAYTCDERIIPTLIELLYSNQHGNDVFWAVEGLRCYLPKTEKVKNKLISVARKRGMLINMYMVLMAFSCDESTFKEIIDISLKSNDYDIVSDAIYVVREHPSDDLMPALIDISKGEKPKGFQSRITDGLRSRAIYAVAFNRTDEGVEVLKYLLNDPNEYICNATERAIREAYQRYPEYPEQIDEEYTSMLIPIATNPNHPERWFAIRNILMSRTEEGVEAIKNLLENPALANPLVQSDSGVQAIAELLSSSDQKSRDSIVDYIKVIYQEYPGRPVRDEDFPDSFKYYPDEMKQSVIERIQSWQTETTF